MTRDDIELLYEYDRWANNRVLQAASALTPEQFLRDLGGAFKSVRDTLLHIVGGEWIWLAFWKDPRPDAAAIEQLRKKRDAEFAPERFRTVGAIESRWREVEARQREFVAHVSDEVLRREFPFRGTTLGLQQLMQHLANHSTYHRGQISLMMRQLGAKPVATDFHVFLIEGRGQAAPASRG